jgi:hypothetical protein
LVVSFVFVILIMCIVCPLLPVYLDCPFLVVSFVFVHMTRKTKTKETTKNGQSRYIGNNGHTIHMMRITKTKETTKNGQSRYTGCLFCFCYPHHVYCVSIVASVSGLSILGCLFCFCYPHHVYCVSIVANVSPLQPRRIQALRKDKQYLFL